MVDYDSLPPAPHETDELPEESEDDDTDERVERDADRPEEEDAEECGEADKRIGELLIERAPGLLPLA